MHFRREHVVAFQRGDEVIVLATRLSERLAQAGGWVDTTVKLPAGEWTDFVSGRRITSGVVRMADLLEGFSVALLGKTTPTSR